MRRACPRVIALTAMVACFSVTAHAADTTLTLACQGTQTRNDAKPEPISMGIIVNFPARTVQGFGLAPVKIIGINDVTIFFDNEPLTPHIFGTIDRVTGNVDATWASMDYALKCTPTQRMF